MVLNQLRILVAADRMFASERGASCREIAHACGADRKAAERVVADMQLFGVQLELVCSCHARFGRVFRYADGQARITTDAAEEVLACRV